MGLKQFTVNFHDLGISPNIRLWVPFKLPVIKHPYDKLINYLSCYESGSRPKGGINNENEGEAISLGGEQISPDGSVDLTKIPYVSCEFYANAKKGKVQDNDILVCKDGALTGKTCLVEFEIFPVKEVMVNEHVYIIRGNDQINQRLLFYLTRNNLFQLQVKDLAFRKKGQPGLNIDHLRRIKIPCIPGTEQEKIIKIIDPLEKRIKTLNDSIKYPQQIIDLIFSKKFKFDIKKIYSIEKIAFRLVSNELTRRNSSIRCSARWYKIPAIQKVMYENNPYIKKLGRYIISTNNGWSPSCRETDSLHYVFGVNSISKNGSINYKDLKVSNETKPNVQNYYAKEGDLFVSRGNTVELVALASVVENIDEIEKNIIFPDLFRVS